MPLPLISSQHRQRFIRGKGPPRRLRRDFDLHQDVAEGLDLNAVEEKMLPSTSNFF